MESLNSRTISTAFGVTVVGIMIYAVFVRTSSETGRAAQPPASGWEELGLCSNTLSFDQHKGLELAGDGVATMADYSADEDGHLLRHGEWRYDAGAKKYSITLDGETNDYSLVSPDHIGTCMLIKGDIAAADLIASWFSTHDIEEPDYGGPYDR